MKQDNSRDSEKKKKDNRNFIIPNNLGGRLPLYYNYVCCTVINNNVERIDLTYYDKRFRKFRNPEFHNDFSRILE